MSNETARPHPSDAPPPDYPTWLYAAVHGGNPGDRGFYVKACHGADAVLELGCGGGRLGAAIAEQGSRVVGIDRDRDAVGRAAELGVDARVADLRDFDLAQRFDRIIAPYNVLYCLLQESHLLDCLRRVRTHLREDGEFVFDIYCADALHQGFELDPGSADGSPFEESESDPIMQVHANGKVWDVYEDSRWWPVEQRIDASFRHRPTDGGAEIEATIPQRYLLSGELSSLLAEAGLAIRGWYGDFEFTPFDVDAELMVVRAVPSDV